MRKRRPRRRSILFSPIELKFFDTFVNNVAIAISTDASGGEQNQSSTITPSTMGQGVTQSQRNGRKVTWKSIMLQGFVTVGPQSNATATDNATLIFIALVIDTQTNGANLSSEEVFVNASGVAALSASVLPNLQQQDRFIILRTKRFKLENPSITFDGTNMEQSGLVHHWSMFHRFGGGSTSISTGTSGTGSIVNVTDNSLHVIAFASNVNLAPTLSYFSRIRFLG